MGGAVQPIGCIPQFMRFIHQLRSSAGSYEYRRLHSRRYPEGWFNKGKERRF